MNVIAQLIGGVVSPVLDFFNHRQQIRAQTQQNKLAYLKAVGDRNAERAAQGLAADVSWESQSINAGEPYRGYELAIISIPVVLCFTPYSYIVRDGFQALDGTPQWFQLVFIIIFLANYGVRFWRRKITT